jgi:hypothetical protein
MLPTQSQLLPIVPVAVLKKHQVHEKYDNRFRACARLIQAIWREEQGLPIGNHHGRLGRKRRLGSLLSPAAAEAGRNFLTPAVAHYARRMIAYQEPGAMIDERRLMTNLLSSMCLSAHLAAPLAFDLDLATRVIKRLLPAIDVQSVKSVLFEHSPGRQDPELTGDRSAFDVAIVYVRQDGQRGLLGLEIKFSESLQDPTPAELNLRYDDLAEASGLFKEPASALLRVNPLQQLFREHLLAQSAVMRGDYAEATFLLVAPANNNSVQRGADLYAAHLNSVLPGQVPFANIALEAFIAAIGLEGDMEYSFALHKRWCAWDRVHEIVEQELCAKDQDWGPSTPHHSPSLALIGEAA